MARKKTAGSDKARAPRLSHVCQALQCIAPLELAQSWDNVGLVAGDLHRVIGSALLCIDLTPEVADEVIAGKYDLVVAYHPPIFRPITRLTAQSSGPEAAVFRCIQAGTAVYSPHTALDAAEGGTCDVIARMCGITQTESIEYADPGASEVKFVTFVPAANVDAVADAMFAAGAGRIGEYQQCSYRLEGQGTFFGGDATNPAVGRKGQLERVEEVRLEMVCPSRKIPQAVAALRGAHPYEEPAFDIYPLASKPARGTGRWGALPKPMPLAQLARKLKRATSATCAQIVGDPAHEVSRAVILVGAAGSTPFKVGLTSDDVIITGEIRHHDALSYRRIGASAIALNHWTSERPVLKALADRLSCMLPGLDVVLSKADREPFSPV